MILRSNSSPTTIGDICDFESGNGFSPQDWKTTGLPIIRIQNLNGSDSFNYFDGEPDPAWIVEPNDLLFAWAGVKGVSFGPTIWKGPRGVLNQHIYRIRPKKGVNKRWLYYALLEVTAEIESKAHGFKTSLVHVRKADITRARISLPGEHEQEAVATALGCWDTAIETTERLIAAKEVYIGAVTERIYRRSPGWSRYRLGDFLQETKVLHGHGDYVIGSVGKNGIKPRDEVYSKDLTSNHERNLLVKPGWLCFGLASDCMAFGVNSTNQTYSVSPAYRTFQINGADPRFFEGYLRVFNGRLSKRFLITSARQGKAIDFEGLFNTECYFPSREEQQQIASAVLLMREELDHLRQLREALKRQKRGLMQKLLTGKWRIQMEEGVPV